MLDFIFKAVLLFSVHQWRRTLLFLQIKGIALLCQILFKKDNCLTFEVLFKNNLKNTQYFVRELNGVKFIYSEA